MKSKVSPELLANCLAEVQSGRLTIEECAAAHPSVQEELRSLLQIAGAIPPVPIVTPDPAFRIRGRVELVEAISASKVPVTNAFWQRWIGGWRQPRLLVNRRMGMPALIIALVIALTTAAGGGAVYAAQGALPGDALYGIKTATENVQINLAGTDEAKAQTYADLADKRVAEIDKASQNGNAAATAAASDKFVDEINEVDQHLAQAAASGKDVSDTATRLAEILARHESTLAALEGRTPNAAKDALAKATDKAQQGLANALAHISDASSDDKQAADSDTGSKDHPITPTPGGAISPTLQVTLTQTITDVRNLANDPNVRGESFKGLLAKLDVAEAALRRGQTNVALHELNAFVNELNAMERSGHISAADYQTLFAQYQALVEALHGTPKPAVTPNPTPNANVTPNANTTPGATPSAEPTDVPHGKSDEAPGRQGRDVEHGRNGDEDTSTSNAAATPTPTPQPGLNPGGQPVPGKGRR